MKSDVATIQLSQPRKVSYAEYALLAVVLLVATKFCTLPAVLTGIAGSKAVWVVFILLGIEMLSLFFATKTAKCGGLAALPLRAGIRIPLLLFFAFFFALKLTAFAREISTYYALSLFENAPVLPIMIIHLIACALLAKKGYMGVGRVTEVFVWLFAFVFLFVVIFTRTEGDLFNALSIFNPDVKGMGQGIGKGMAWFGDSVAISFLDLSGEERFSPHAQGVPIPKKRRNAKRKILFAAVTCSFLLVVLFFAVFISSYGEAAKMTDYAFIKLSTFKANTDELGSADWPVIILWAIISSLYLALLFLSGKECITGIVPSLDQKKKNMIPFFLLGGAAVVISTLLLDEEGDYESFMTRFLNVITFLSVAGSIAVGIYSLIKAKGEKDEKAQ
ncbi:MAG TPA: hypothetical protein DIC18_01120 [Clostridiales bacterium]|nr:hypothetical protein [Clostridiales bacterium]